MKPNLVDERLRVSDTSSICTTPVVPLYMKERCIRNGIPAGASCSLNIHKDISLAQHGIFVPIEDGCHSTTGLAGMIKTIGTPIPAHSPCNTAISEFKFATSPMV
jgi:hypothetical protein